MTNFKIMLIALITMISFNMYYCYGTTESVVVTVTSKERIHNEDESIYLIYTDEGVFKNTDSIYYFKFNSSDIYGELKEGESYRLNVYGFRIPFLSKYKNIINFKLEEIK